MENQTNVQGTQNQNLGENNMNILSQIGVLYSQLTPQQMKEITMGMLKNVLAAPNSEDLLKEAGYKQQQNQNAGANVNQNGNYELSPETFNSMVQQIASMQEQIAQLSQVQMQPQQQPQQIQYTSIDNNTVAKLQQIEAALVERTNMYNNYVQWGFNTYPVLADIERLKKEYANLTGAGVKNQVVNGINAVGNFGQERIANEFVPNVVNTTSSVIADGFNIVADLVKNVGGIAVNTTSQVLQTGANTVGQIGTVASNAGQTYANSAFGLLRK